MIGDGSGGILRGGDGTGCNDDTGNDGDLGGDEGGIGGDDEGIGGDTVICGEGGKSEMVIIFPPNKHFK